MAADKNIERSCLNGDEIVSYLYGEMTDSRRTLFEIHLLDCAACTDEFAGLSLARLGVYEWNRDEFAAMETPLIAIPYEKESSEKVSWLESWLGPIFSTPKWAIGGGLAFAMLFLGFTLFTAGNLDNDITAANVAPVNITAADSDTKQMVEVVQHKPLYNKEKEEIAIRPVKASVTSHSRKRSNLSDQATAQIKDPTVRKNNSEIKAKAPRLNNFEDEDDNTLRLADLFADADTRR